MSVQTKGIRVRALRDGDGGCISFEAFADGPQEALRIAAELAELARVDCGPLSAASPEGEDRRAERKRDREEERALRAEALATVKAMAALATDGQRIPAGFTVKQFEEPKPTPEELAAQREEREDDYRRWRKREADSEEMMKLSIAELRAKASTRALIDHVFEVATASAQSAAASGKEFFTPAWFEAVIGDVVEAAGMGMRPDPEHAEDLAEEVIATGANALALAASEADGPRGLFAYGAALAVSAADDAARSNVTHLRNAALALAHGIGTTDDGETLENLRALVKTVKASRAREAASRSESEDAPQGV